MTLEETIKNFEQEIVEFEGFKKIHAVTHEDYAHIEKTRQLAEWLKELKERRKKDVPDTNVGDMVSRQKAIDALKGLPTWWADAGGFYGGAQPPMTALLDPEDAVSAIANLPSAQPNLQPTCNNLATDAISRRAAIDAVCMEWCNVKHQDCKHSFDDEKDDYYWCDGCETVLRTLPDLPSAQPEWNNHTVACLLAELFDDTCACNYNGIDEWLPEKCELLDSCPNPVGVACWEQYLKHRVERRTDEGSD